MVQSFQTIEDFNDYVQNRAVEDEDFRARLLSDPKAVMEEELDLTIPNGFDIQVHEDTSTTAHFVIPPSAKLSDGEMRTVTGGWGWCIQI